MRRRHRVVFAVGSNMTNGRMSAGGQHMWLNMSLRAEQTASEQRAARTAKQAADDATINRTLDQRPARHERRRRTAKDRQQRRQQSHSDAARRIGQQPAEQNHQLAPPPDGSVAFHAYGDNGRDDVLATGHILNAAAVAGELSLDLGSTSATRVSEYMREGLGTPILGDRQRMPD